MRASFGFLLTLAACGSSSGSTTDASPPDAVPGPDAPPPDATTPFGCLGLPLPTSAPATVHVTGKAEEIKNLATVGVANATITAHAVAGDGQLAMTTSAADGTYTLAISTSGKPVDGYVLGHHDPVNNTPYLDTYLYPPHPLAGDQDNATVLLLTSDTLNLLGGLAGVTPDQSKGMIGLIVSDCNGTPLAGATVTTDPGGTVVYDSGSLPSSKATATAADGRAYILNVAPGTVTVHATVGGMTLRAHDVNARAHAVTLTVIEP